MGSYWTRVADVSANLLTNDRAPLTVQSSLLLDIGCQCASRALWPPSLSLAPYSHFAVAICSVFSDVLLATGFLLTAAETATTQQQ